MWFKNNRALRGEKVGLLPKGGDSMNEAISLALFQMMCEATVYFNLIVESIKIKLNEKRRSHAKE